MKIAGIIAEYNPFHNGHKYHIEETKKLTGADYIIVVMSGDFTQRGIPAIMPKHIRAEVALNEGADLIIELPLPYATGTAETFAYGAVSLLVQLGCVDYISFGCETNDMKSLQKIAKLLVAPTEEYNKLLNESVKTGHAFPQARQEAIAILLGEEAARLLETSNNILAIEYLKALIKLNSSIMPVAVLRQGNSYTDLSLSKESFPSAMALRNIDSFTDKDEVLKLWSDYISTQAMNIIADHYNSTWPVFIDDFSPMLSYRLSSITKEELLACQDVTNELSDRIMNSLEKFTTISQFALSLKTKNMTYTRITRALLHILLNTPEGRTSDVLYARVLGFKKESSPLLNQIKNNTCIPLITKLANADTILSEEALQALKLDIQATHLYHSMITQKYGTHLPNEYRTVIPIV